MKRYELLGKEEVDCICDFCGTKEIGTAFVVKDLENGRVLKFGSTCIKKALQITTSEIKKEFQLHLDSFLNKCFEQQYPIWKEMEEIAQKYRKENNYPFGFLPNSEERYWDLHKQYNEIEKQKRKEKEKYTL